MTSLKMYFAGAHEGSNTRVLKYYFSVHHGHEVHVDSDRGPFDIAFTNNGRLLEGVSAQLKVNTQHGCLFLGDAKCEPQYGIKLILAASESEKEMMVRNGFQSENVLVTGQPRMDELFYHYKIKDVRQHFLESKGLNSEALTVLYAPTYSRRAFGVGDKFFFASSRSADDDELTAIDLIQTCRELEFNLVIRLHKYIKRSYTGNLLPPWLVDHFQDVEVHDNEVEPNSIPTLVSSDVLITDFSSITSDFLALDRPVIFLDPQLGWRYTDMWHATSAERYEMGVVVETSSQLGREVAEFQARGKEFDESRRKMQSIYQPFFDGKCCERVQQEMSRG